MPNLPGVDEVYGRRPEIRPSTSVAEIGPTGIEGRAAQFMGVAADELGEANKYIQKAKTEFDELTVQDASNKLDQARLKSLYDPNDGVVSSKGAVAADPQFLQKQIDRFKTATSAIRGTLTDPAQVALFDRHSAVMSNQFNGAVYQHVAQETMNHKIQVYTTTIDQAKNSAAQFDDPGPIASADINRNNIDIELFKAYGAIDRLAQLHGNSTAENANWAGVEKTKLRDEVYGNRILRIAVQDPIKAEATYRHLISQDANALSPKARLAIEDHLSGKVDDQLSRVGAKNTMDGILSRMTMEAAVQQTAQLDLTTGRTVNDIAKRMKKDGLSSADVDVTLGGKQVKGTIALDAQGKATFVSDTSRLEASVGVLPPVVSKIDVAMALQPGEVAARAWAERVRPGNAKFSDQTVANFKTYLNSVEAQQNATQRQAWQKTEQALFGLEGNGPTTVPELIGKVGEDVLRNLPAGSLHGVMIGLQANEQRKNGKLNTDPAVYSDLLQKTWAGEIKEDWAYASFIGRGLSHGDVQQLRHERDLAQNGTPAVQEMIKKTYTEIERTWKFTPQIGNNPMYQSLIETQRNAWLFGVRAEMAAVEGGTPQQRAAKQIEIINKWSSPEKIREYQPDIADALVKNRARQDEVINYLSQTNPSARDAIRINAKDDASIVKAMKEAAPGQQLLLWNKNANNKKGDWVLWGKGADQPTPTQPPTSATPPKVRSTWQR